MNQTYTTNKTYSELEFWERSVLPSVFSPSKIKIIKKKKRSHVNFRGGTHKSRKNWFFQSFHLQPSRFPRVFCHISHVISQQQLHSWRGKEGRLQFLLSMSNSNLSSLVIHSYQNRLVGHCFYCLAWLVAVEQSYLFWSQEPKASLCRFSVPILVSLAVNNAYVRRMRLRWSCWLLGK